MLYQVLAVACTVFVSLTFCCKKKRRLTLRKPVKAPYPKDVYHSVSLEEKHGIRFELDRSPPQTIGSIFRRAVRKFPEAIALRGSDGWVWSYERLYDSAQKFAKSLCEIQYKHSVMIYGCNSPYWLIAALGCVLNGNVYVGAYVTDTPETVLERMKHARSSIVVCDEVQRAVPLRKLMPKGRAVVWNLLQGRETPVAGIVAWEDFMNTGRNTMLVPHRSHDPGATALMIYTSGTSGSPKAVMISHDAVTSAARSVCARAKLLHEERVVSYLPLSHVAAQIADIFVPLYGAAHGAQFTVDFADPKCLKDGKLLKDVLVRVRPTFFFGVPRVWEKIRAGIETKLHGIGNDFVRSALGLVRQAANRAYLAGQYGSAESPGWAYYLLARPVLHFLKSKIGLDRCRLCIAGAAPVSSGLQEFFGTLDINLLNLYGMSECSGPHFLCTPDEYKIGSCGRVLPGMDACIDASGELVLRGRNVMSGYFENAKASKDAISEFGWLRTGDLGRIDSDGFLFLTGRKKEVIIGSGGHNVHPVPVEKAALACCEGAAQRVFLCGNNRKFLSALVIASDPQRVDKKRIDAGIERYNREKASSNAEKIRKFIILRQPFSIETGELTATMKVKRKFVAEKFKEDIDAMYN